MWHRASWDDGRPCIHFLRIPPIFGSKIAADSNAHHSIYATSLGPVIATD